jgi:hypothetical protein
VRAYPRCDTRVMVTSSAAGSGFLLAVLWFDLMFDVQALRQPGAELSEHVLASIAGYYARVTTAAAPMNRLIAAVMLATLASLVVEVVQAHVSLWVSGISLALATVAILLAALRTVPTAVRLGTRRDAPLRQSSLARAILRQHLICFASIGVVLVLQLASS